MADTWSLRAASARVIQVVFGFRFVI